MWDDDVAAMFLHAPFERVDLKVGSFKARIGLGEQADGDAVASHRSEAEQTKEFVPGWVPGRGLSRF